MSSSLINTGAEKHSTGNINRIQKYFKLSDIYHICDTTKTILKRKFITLNAFEKRMIILGLLSVPPTQQLASPRASHSRMRTKWHIA